MKQLLQIFALCSTIVASTPAWSFDLMAGEQLVDENCNSCHGSELYTRKDRLVTSRSGLTNQVQRCELALGLTWFDEDVENAAEFLNQKYYRFDK